MASDLLIIPDGKDWFDLATLVISFFGVIVGASLTYQANRIAKSNLELADREQKTLAQKISSEERELFRSNYRKIIDALGIIFSSGQVNDEAKDLFWKARDEARLELPNDIATYTQDLFDLMWEAYLLWYNKITGDTSLPKGAERSEAVDRHTEIISKLIKERPSEVYSKYMRVKDV